MEETTTPVRDFLKTNVQQMCFAMLLPEASKGSNQRAHRIGVASLVPFVWADFLGKSFPSGRTTQLGLRVRLLCVALFHAVALHHAVRIGCFTGFYSRRCRRKVLEQCPFIFFISDVVSLKYNSAFELAKFRIFR